MTGRQGKARVIKRAKEVAASGRHVGWFYVAWELKEKMGEPLALQVLEKEPIRFEIDRICDVVTKKKWGADA